MILMGVITAITVGEVLHERPKQDTAVYFYGNRSRDFEIRGSGIGMNNDSNIARAMCLVPHHMMLAFMQGNHNKIIDDSNYWNLLGTAWKAGGCFKDQNDWMAMFRSKRRNRQKIMKTRERREFARLPKKLKAYRAYADPIEIEQSICWSLDKKFVERYAKAKDLQIAECTFNRDDVFAYFNRRQESEILVWRNEP